MGKVMIKMDFSKFRYEVPELLFESEDEESYTYDGEVSNPAEPASELILQCDLLAARLAYLGKILKENGIDFD